MKSSPRQLEDRGFVTDSYLSGFCDCNKQVLINLLNSGTAQERTAAAYGLVRYSSKEVAQILCEALKKEKKLYSKIALTEALGQMGEEAVTVLIPLLGKIGSNHYKKLPDKPFNKKNYPLPRDIVARTIVKMGGLALPYLEEVVEKGDRRQLVEAIDAIGFISFYHEEHRSFRVLKDCLKRFRDDDLVKWKVVRAFQAFDDKEVIGFLESLVRNSSVNALVWEAKRSLEQLEKRK